MQNVVTHAANNNDVTMCVLASWLFLGIYDAPEITSWHVISMSQMTSTKINHHTFS